MSGKHVGKERPQKLPSSIVPKKTKHIESAEELFSIMSSAGLGVGIITQPKSKNGVANGSR